MFSRRYRNHRGNTGSHHRGMAHAAIQAQGHGPPTGSCHLQCGLGSPLFRLHVAMSAAEACWSDHLLRRRRVREFGNISNNTTK